jgi:perosamine synthetase
MRAMSVDGGNARVNESVPKLPVLTWPGVSLGRDAMHPCLLDLPAVRYTTSGRAAIWHVLRLIGLKPGERVLMPSYHCMSMIAPVVLLGGEVEFYPISADGSADMDYLRSATRRPVRAILAAHFFGLPRAMRAIRQLCDDHDIAFIEDCAHALWGKHDGYSVGSLGDYAIGSMTKFFPVPEGGCVASSRYSLEALGLRASPPRRELKVLVDILERATSFERLPGLNAPLNVLWRIKSLLRRKGEARVDDSHHDLLSAQASLADLDVEQAEVAMSRVALAVVKHTRMQRAYENRRAHFSRLLACSMQLSNAHPLASTLPSGAAPYVFPVWAEDPDNAFNALRDLGIAVFRWDWRWPGTPHETSDHGNSWAHHVLQLPCHQDLSLTDMGYIEKSLTKVFGRLTDRAEAAQSASADTHCMKGAA